MTTITVKQAQREHRKAEAALRVIELEAETDLSITPSQILEARTAVELAAGRIRGAERLEREAAEAEARAKRTAGRRRREAAAEVERARKLRDERNAIESGAAETFFTDLVHHTNSPDAARKLKQIEAWRASGAEEWPGYDTQEVPA